MNQQIITDFPPNYAEIVARFPHVRHTKGVVYSWGDRIFNPDNEVIAPSILAHEAAHGQRQGETENAIRTWWKRYLDDPRFTLAEELPAHRAEYRWWIANGNRADRRRMLKFISQRLSGPLYGQIVTRAQAEAALVALEEPLIELSPHMAKMPTARRRAEAKRKKATGKKRRHR